MPTKCTRKGCDGVYEAGIVIWLDDVEIDWDANDGYGGEIIDGTPSPVADTPAGIVATTEAPEFYVSCNECGHKAGVISISDELANRWTYRR